MNTQLQKQSVRRQMTEDNGVETIWFGCPCGGHLRSASVIFTLGNTTSTVPGYRCDKCGFEVLDAAVSSTIKPLGC